MGSIRIMWSSLLLWMAAGVAVCAQSFRRVTNVDDLESGVRYVLAGYCSDTPDSVFVMNRPDGTGTDTVPWIRISWSPSSTSTDCIPVRHPLISGEKPQMKEVC